MLTLKKPKHLSAYPTSIRHNYPVVGFYEETLTLTAEMEEGNISFSIRIIQSESGGGAVEICNEMPIKPKEGQIYVLLDDPGVAREVSHQIGCIKRLSKSAEKSIIEWVLKRAKEYANCRIL